MNKKDKIYIAGNSGLIGTELTNRLLELGYKNQIFRNSKELDLRNQANVNEFFRINKPDFVFLAAAKVGGINANINSPIDFIYNNLQIQNNVIQASYTHGVRKLVFFGASCIYPKNSSQPMREDELFKGEPEKTNEFFAYAKIAGIKLCQAYNKQFNTNYVTVIPSNVYGPYDNFDLDNSHVLSALIRKIHEAKTNNLSELTLWGSGTPLREFIYVSDLINAIVLSMKSSTIPEIINIGSGEEISIRELALLIKNIIGYEGNIKFDISKPDGIHRKFLDSSKIIQLGYKNEHTLEQGITKTINWYLKQSKI
jgi:GDP-L-fucose synthase